MLEPALQAQEVASGTWALSPGCVCLHEPLAQQPCVPVVLRFGLILPGLAGTFAERL